MFLSVLTGKIAETFFGAATQTTRGYTMQLSTFAFAATVVSSLVMSVLSIRFRYKSLFIVGASLLVAATAGIFLAPTFLWMLILFAVQGIAAPMVFITGITLVGDFVPQDRKAKAVSYLISAGFLGTIVGDVILLLLSQGGFFAIPGNWRYAYLLISLPTIFAVLPIAFIGISSNLHRPQSVSSRETYIGSFKQVLKNKSAVACLVGSLFFSGAIGLLSLNYFQQQFALSLQYSTLIALVSLSLFAAGSFVVGQLTNKVGVKTLTVVGAVGDGIFIVLLFSAPNLWIGLAFNWAHVWFATTATTALACLALDQVPKARGTMMSLNRMFSNIGNTISPAIGGTMLAMFPQPSLGTSSSGYQVAGLVLGVMSLVAAAIIFFLAKDQTKTLLRGRKETKIQ